jgi:hypothetical protein
MPNSATADVAMQRSNNGVAAAKVTNQPMIRQDA